MSKEMIEHVGFILCLIGLCVTVGSLCLTIWIAHRQGKQLEKITKIGEETSTIAISQNSQLANMTTIEQKTQEIASTQIDQLKDITKIGKDTYATAHLLQADQDKLIMVEKFFCPKENEKFLCIFPAMHVDKPLFDIHSGDYYALHNIQTLFGTDKLDNNKLDLVYTEEMGDPSNCIVDGKCIVDGSIIYLGSPQVNPDLRVVAPPIELRNGRHAGAVNIFKELLGDTYVDLPCWFANEGNIKKICFSNNSKPLTSPVDDEYVDWRNHNTNNAPYIEPRKDYAIVLRLNTKGSKKVFVLAGIHQHGTWIAGEFLKQLAKRYCGESNCSISEHQRAIFLQNDKDFVAVIEGEFDKEKLTAKKPSIYDNNLWRRNGTKWEHIYP
jgi:hypothetical protein